MTLSLDSNRVTCVPSSQTLSTLMKSLDTTTAHNTFNPFLKKEPMSFAFTFFLSSDSILCFKSPLNINLVGVNLDRDLFCVVRCSITILWCFFTLLSSKYAVLCASTTIDVSRVVRSTLCGKDKDGLLLESKGLVLCSSNKMSSCGLVFGRRIGK